MKILQRFLSVLAGISLLILLCITAAEAAIYLDFDFYQNEYEKYEVLDDLNMTMDNVMEVTHHMMAYLRGNEEELRVVTQVDGREQDFFNEQDRFHMEEVKHIFCNALRIRRIAAGIFLGALVLLVMMKAEWKRMISKAYMVLTGLTACITGILAVLMIRNFNQCFVIFHEIFFDNDLWMFEPETDYMIRMLPEGLFADFAARIGIFAGVFLLIVFGISLILHRAERRKQEDRDLFNIS